MRQRPAVITRERDNGIFVQAAGFQNIDNASNAGVQLGEHATHDFVPVQQTTQPKRQFDKT